MEITHNRTDRKARHKTKQNHVSHALALSFSVLHASQSRGTLSPMRIELQLRLRWMRLLRHIANTIGGGEVTAVWRDIRQFAPKIARECRGMFALFGLSA